MHFDRLIEIEYALAFSLIVHYASLGGSTKIFRHFCNIVFILIFMSPHTDLRWGGIFSLASLANLSPTFNYKIWWLRPCMPISYVIIQKRELYHPHHTSHHRKAKI